MEHTNLQRTAWCIINASILIPVGFLAHWKAPGHIPDNPSSYRYHLHRKKRENEEGGPVSCYPQCQESPDSSFLETCALDLRPHDNSFQKHWAPGPFLLQRSEVPGADCALQGFVAVATGHLEAMLSTVIYKWLPEETWVQVRSTVSPLWWSGRQRLKCSWMLFSFRGILKKNILVLPF